MMAQYSHSSIVFNTKRLHSNGNVQAGQAQLIVATDVGEEIGDKVPFALYVGRSQSNGNQLE